MKHTLAALLLGLTGFGAAQSITLSNGDTLDSIEAQVLCKSQVRDSLVSPRSAKFPGAWQGNMNQPVKLGNSWNFVVVVDADNVFGANLRAEYLCVLDGDADSISISEVE